MRRTLIVSPMILLSALALTACSDSSPEVSGAATPAGSSAAASSAGPSGASTAPSTSAESSSPSTPTSEAPTTSAAPPAAAGAVKGTGYSYNGPAGWTDGKAAVSTSAKVDTLLIDKTDKDGFADNLNVIRTAGVGSSVTLSAVELASTAQLKKAGATNIKTLPRTKVDGTEASHITADAKAGPTPYAVEQLYILRNGTSYTVTFSFSSTASPQVRSSAISTVTSSWKWS